MLNASEYAKNMNKTHWNIVECIIDLYVYQFYPCNEMIYYMLRNDLKSAIYYDT